LTAIENGVNNKRAGHTLARPLQKLVPSSDAL